MSRQKKGFTLAEVLITLGIIGIITVMLLPKFFEVVNKKVAVETLFNSHAKIETAFRKAMADDQVFDLKESELFQSIGGDGICNSDMDPNGAECKDFFKNLKKYIKIADIKATNYHDIRNLVGSSRAAINWEFINKNINLNNISNSIYLLDGTVIYAYQFSNKPVRVGTSLIDSESYIVFDVNGKDVPNQMGRDIFTFRFSKEGNIQPEYSISALKGQFCNYLITNEGYSLNDALKEVNRTVYDYTLYKELPIGYQACYYYPDNKSENNCDTELCGQGCAAKIFEEHGMNY